MERELEYRSKCGIPLYVYKNTAQHGFYVSVFARCGSMYESEGDEGITHLLEHCLIRNVNKLYGGTLYAELDAEGMEFNASTYSEMLQFYVTAATGKFSTGMAVLGKLFSPITLSRREMDAEKMRVKAEIRESDDKSSLSSFTAARVFVGTPLAHSIVGTNGSVDAVSLTRLEAYRRTALCSGNVFFYITGNVTDADIAEALAAIDGFDIVKGEGNSNLAPVPSDFFRRPREVFVKNSDYTAVRLTFDLDMSRMSVAETDLLYDSLITGYNSRLFIELSEKRGLVYDISGNLERYRNVGTLSFFFEVNGRHTEQAVEIVVSVLNSMKSSEGITCIKAGYTDNAFLLYDDMRELNFTFAYDNHIMSEGYTSVAERRERYAAVTEHRLAELACMLFVRDNLTVTLKADKRRTDTAALGAILDRLDT